MKGMMGFAASDRIRGDRPCRTLTSRGGFRISSPRILLREIFTPWTIWGGFGVYASRRIREALSRQTGLARAISWLWAVPVFERLADYQYRRIAAARRRDDPGGHPHCPLT